MTAVMESFMMSGLIPSVHWEFWICRHQTGQQTPISREMSEVFILYCMSIAVTVQES